METEEQRSEQSEGAVETTGDESPEEFAEQVESDQAYNPDDEELQRFKGG